MHTETPIVLESIVQSYNTRMAGTKSDKDVLLCHRDLHLIVALEMGLVENLYGIHDTCGAMCGLRDL
jgi:hypothetical protein